MWFPEKTSLVLKMGIFNSKNGVLITVKHYNNVLLCSGIIVFICVNPKESVQNTVENNVESVENLLSVSCSNKY